MAAIFLHLVMKEPG